jgi:Transposase IS4
VVDGGNNAVDALNAAAAAVVAETPVGLARANAIVNDATQPTQSFQEVNDSPEWPLPPTVTVHNTNWFEMPHAELQQLNGHIPRWHWGLRLPTGEIWEDGSNHRLTISRLDVFLQVFPLNALTGVLESTNEYIIQSNERATITNHEELLKFFGIILLETKYEWSNHTDLWSRVAPSW